MAGIDIEIAIGGDLTAALDRAIAAGLDLTPAMADIAGHLADAARERFETERDPTGAPWLPSARAREESGQTLTLSGDLRSSIREDWGADFAAAGPEASGGAAIYAAIHQFGGTIRPKVKKALSFAGRIVASVMMPRRAYLGWNEASETYALEVLADHLGQAFGGEPA